MKVQWLLPEGKKPEFIVVAGPTASGKSQVALELAQAINGSIVCCDSVQIYRGFDVGSAKPSLAEQAVVPHELFNEFAWDENCDAAIYAARARDALDRVRAAGRIPIVVGGTGLYLRALLGQAWDDDLPGDETLRTSLAKLSSDELFARLKAMDPRRASEVHANDRFRVIRALEINILTGKPVRAPGQSPEPERAHVMVMMTPPRETLYGRINERAGQMIRGGLVDEVRDLLSRGVSPDCKPMRSIGYKETVAAIHGAMPFSELERYIATATRQYAKRQMTWFRKVPADIVMEDPKSTGALIGLLKDLL